MKLNFKPAELVLISFIAVLETVPRENVFCLSFILHLTREDNETRLILSKISNLTTPLWYDTMTKSKAASTQSKQQQQQQQGISG